MICDFDSEKSSTNKFLEITEFSIRNFEADGEVTNISQSKHEKILIFTPAKLPYMQGHFYSENGVAPSKKRWHILKFLRQWHCQLGLVLCN